MFIDERLAQIATGREASFFMPDFSRLHGEIRNHYHRKSILVIGGAGTIGAACVREILQLEPARLDVVDINENGLARLTRAIRSDRNLARKSKISFNALDFGSPAMEALVREYGPWDAILNFAAVKHVRSEKNFPCALHMLDVNVVKQDQIFETLAKSITPLDYFVISTDKAADPSNLMGASKRLLEYFVFGRSLSTPQARTSSARFANVAFSAGSLLESFVDRYSARVPLACPDQTKRYFISPQEAAQICLIGQVRGMLRTVIVPRMTPEDHLVDLKDVADNFLRHHGKEAIFVDSEADGYALLENNPDGPDYPVILTPRDTAGEKEAEKFIGEDEKLVDIGLETLVSVETAVPDTEMSTKQIERLRAIVAGRDETATIADIHQLIADCIPRFKHISSSNLLDDRI